MTSPERDQPRDAGFTLVEVLLSMAILGVIMTAISAALIVFLNTGAEASRRDDHSGGSAVAASYLDRDLASADTVLTSGTDCSGTANKLAFKWTQWTASQTNPAPAPDKTWTTAYRVVSDPGSVVPGGGGRFQLERVYCRPGATAVTTVLVRNLRSSSDFAATAGAVGTCTNGRLTTVTLEPYNEDSSSDFTWSGCVGGRRS